MLFMPHLVIVRLEMVLALVLSENTVPEKISWKISRNGMTVMAAVVVLTKQDTNRESMSEANVIRNMEIAKSTMNHGVIIPSVGNAYFAKVQIMIVIAT